MPEDLTEGRTPGLFILLHSSSLALPTPACKRKGRERKGAELLGGGRETGRVVKPNAGVLSSQVFLGIATGGVRMSWGQRDSEDVGLSDGNYPCVSFWAAEGLAAGARY